MAVYTDVSDGDLSDFLASYDIGRAISMKGIAEGVENSNFLLRTEAGTFILTLYERRVQASDLPFFIALMRHLSMRGLTCPEPVSRRDGGVLGMLGGRPAALVTFLEGLSVRRPSPAQCAAAGAALADMHELGSDFTMQRPNALSITAWPALFGPVRDRADAIQAGLAQFIDGELAFLQTNWPADLPGGIIHADLFPDNVLFLGDRVSGLIDFYFACSDSYAYDLAILLNAWCFEADGAFNITKSSEMITAYRRQRPLLPVEITAMPTLVRGAALRFALTRLVDWLDVPAGALVQPKNPLEYVQKIRFHQRLGSARELGFV